MFLALYSDTVSLAGAVGRRLLTAVWDGHGQGTSGQRQLRVPARAACGHRRSRAGSGPRRLQRGVDDRTDVVENATISYMGHPTSLRLPGPVKQRLDAAATRSGESASAVAVRLIDEGLRMADHPGIGFHDSPVHGRVACLVAGPDVAEVIAVLRDLDARGDERVRQTATWFAVPAARIRVAVGYYAAFGDEVDRQIDRRQREAAEARGRYQAEQDLLR